MVRLARPFTGSDNKRRGTERANFRRRGAPSGKLRFLSYPPLLRFLTHFTYLSTVARWSASDKKRGREGTKYSKFHPRGYLSHHLAAISMAVYTDAAHIADGVIGLKQRSLAASDPTE